MDKQEIANSDFDMIAKVLILGNSSVGKTSILIRYVYNKFDFSNISTQGVDNFSKIIQTESCKLKLSLWDTAGQERYRQIISNYYRGAKAAVLVFDLTDNKSLLDIKFWLLELRKQINDNIPIILLGNKQDLIDQYKYNEEYLKEICQDEKIRYYAVSALTGNNIDLAFQKLSKIIKEQYQNDDSMINFSKFRSSSKHPSNGQTHDQQQNKSSRKLSLTELSFLKEDDSFC